MGSSEVLHLGPGISPSLFARQLNMSKSIDIFYGFHLGNQPNIVALLYLCMLQDKCVEADY